MTSEQFARAPNVFDPSKKDREIIKALERAGFEPNACMNCGTCTASCSSGRWTAMRTRQIMNRAALGDASILEDPDIWLCTTCYACFDRCPRDLKVTDAIVELRNLASQRGFMSDKHKKNAAAEHMAITATRGCVPCCKRAPAKRPAAATTNMTGALARTTTDPNGMN